MNSNSELTPMMKQYFEIKAKYKDAFLFFRMGDFYELFFDDAKRASKILNITLTSRGSLNGESIPMCGVPYHSVDGYLAKMIEGNHKVAVCEQTEDPKSAKGVVKRDVLKVLTRGTIIDDSLLSSLKNNYIAAITKTGANYGLSYADLSTGEFKVTEMKNIDDVEREFSRISPSEILIPKILYDTFSSLSFFKINSGIMNFEPSLVFDFKTALEALSSHFKTHSLDGFGVNDFIPGIASAGAIFFYVKEKRSEALNNLNKIIRYNSSEFMSLDESVKRNLELIPSVNNPESITVFKILNHTKTAMGARLLRSWIFSPLKNLQKILKRQNTVTELKSNFSLLTHIHDILHSVNDIERIIARICAGNATPRDLLGLKEGLLQVPKLKNVIQVLNSEFIKDILNYLIDFTKITSLIEKSISSECPSHLREGNFIAYGYNKELDELKDISKNAKVKIAEIQKTEIEKTGIKTLKIKFNNVFGYYIEVSKGQAANVPDYFIRKQTLVNAERYITEELKELENKIFGAEQKSISLEQTLFNEIREEIATHANEIKKASYAISKLDVISSFAKASYQNNWISPNMNDTFVINIEEGRHPVVEHLLPSQSFISNSTYLDNNQNQIILITGPNMAGKSTYIRQVALLVLLAQTGSHIPAKKAEIGIVDRIFTRVGAYDDLSGGKSTFMVEMNEVASILNNATERSLVILDEVGRGTSTYDGISIAWAVIEYLYYETKVKAKTLFATHYHELTSLETSLKGVKNYNIDVKEWNEEIIFLHKIVEGAADKSYGIHVGRLAGLPKDVIKRAKELLAKLESSGMNGLKSISNYGTKTVKKDNQLDFFSTPSQPVISKEIKKFLENLSSVDTLNLTPLESLNLLNNLVKESKDITEKLNQ